jgi:hypothetical protein
MIILAYRMITFAYRMIIFAYRMCLPKDFSCYRTNPQVDLNQTVTTSEHPVSPLRS